MLCCVEGRGIKYHEMFRDLLAVVSMHILEPQSRTFPLYMTVWQLHSILYLEKSRDIWDSVRCQAGLWYVDPDSIGFNITFCGIQIIPKHGIGQSIHCVQVRIIDGFVRRLYIFLSFMLQTSNSPDNRFNFLFGSADIFHTIQISSSRKQ